MPNPTRRHSVLTDADRPPPVLWQSLRRKQGPAYAVYQSLMSIMDTPFDALVALVIWYQKEHVRPA